MMNTMGWVMVLTHTTNYVSIDSGNDKKYDNVENDSNERSSRNTTVASGSYNSVVTNDTNYPHDIDTNPDTGSACGVLLSLSGIGIQQRGVSSALGNKKKLIHGYRALHKSSY
jgi:hypothetical protein